MRFFFLFVFAFALFINSEINANSDLFQKARVLYNEARFDEAISVYQKIINGNPKDINAYLNLAYLYKDLAEHKQGIEVIRKALKFFKDMRLKMLLGRLYYLDGKPSQAISELRHLLPLYPEDALVLFYLGLSYEDIDKFTEADKLYSDVVRLKPDNVLAYLKLGNIYYQKQKLEAAVQSYQKTISLDPSIPEVRSRLAECFARLGEFPEAYKQYAKCLAIHPEDKRLQEGLAETKTKLGDDFFKEKKALASQRRREKSIQVEVSPNALRAPQVRVGIAKIKYSIEFKCGSPFEIIDQQNDSILLKGRKESIYSLIFDKQVGIQLRDEQGNILIVGLDKPCLIRNKSRNSVIKIFDLSSGAGSFWAGWHDQQYRGIIEVIPGGDGFQLINLINLEEYLYSALPSEMPASWPKQALCAQAIAARTWAKQNLARHKRAGFNFCSTVHCQVYKGAQVERQITNQAVDETAGLILVSGNKPIDIFYSNNCGGCTQAGVVDAVSLDFDFPLSPLELEVWLMGRPDTFCNLKEARSANFRWTRLYKPEQLQVMLAKSDIDIGEAIKIIPQRRAMSGHLISIKIQGTRDSRVIEGEHNIRKILGNLLSSAFKIETKFNQENQPEEFIFYGAGFGHGRGLCQAGIKGMALKGNNYRQILKHYYPDTDLKKIY